MDDKTVQEVLDTLTDEQMKVVMFLISEITKKYEKENDNG